MLALYEKLQCQLQADVLNNTQGAASLFKQHGRVQPALGIEIYQNAYRLRLLETLRDTYAYTAMYLGDAWFDSLGLKYIEEQPSLDHNISWFGALFASFLRIQHPVDPDIHELALLDWNLRRAFDGPDSRALLIDDLANIAPDEWDRVVFEFVPTLTRLIFQSNAVAMWQALKELQTPPTVVLFERPVSVLTWRKEFQPHFKTLGAEEGRMLEMALQQIPFGALCEQMVSEFANSDATALVGYCLRDWFQQGLVVGFRLI